MLWPHCGSVPYAAMEDQQILHRLRETLSVEMLEEGNGVPTNLLGIAVPGAAVFDAQAIHLFGGVIAPDPYHLVAKGCQQVRQVCATGDLHFMFGETGLSGFCSDGYSPQFSKGKTCPRHP